MKRPHDSARWGERQRARPSAKDKAAFAEWLETRAVGFADAAAVLKTMHVMALGVAPKNAPDPIEIKNGDIKIRIAVRMPENQAAVWSPERGYEIVSLDLDLELREQFTIFRQLTRITRKALIPRMFVQIYSVNPMLSVLNPK